MARAFALAAIAAAGCVSPPAVDAPADPVAVVCEASTATGVGAIGQLGVAVTAAGATAIWVPTGGGPVMTQRWSSAVHPLGAPEVAWPGSYDAATVAAIGDQVVVGAVAGDLTWMVSAPLGLPPYRELALLGGVVGASPVVLAGGQRVTASVSYGGMLVNGFDLAWGAHTSELVVLTPSSREVAATPAEREAVVVWSADGGCFVERVFDAATGTGWVDAGACGAPRIASSGKDVALVFERDGGVYYARANAAQLHPSRALRIADGTAPRVVASGGTYWVSYLDTAGALQAGFVVGSSELRTVEVAATADAHELAIAGDAPRVFASAGGSLTASALCAE